MEQQITTTVIDSLRSTFTGTSNIALYQVGSSVSARIFNDIDVVFVDCSCAHGALLKSLAHLRNSIERGVPHEGAFLSTDSATREKVVQAVEKTREKTRQLPSPTKLRVEFTFGPIREEPRDEELVLHVCGPLDLLDLIALSRYLPFHAAGFLAKNNIVLGPPLDLILPRPNLEMADILRWLELMLKVVKGNSPLEYKGKIARKAALSYLLYRGAVNPYEGASKLAELRDLSEVTHAEELVQYWEQMVSNIRC